MTDSVEATGPIQLWVVAFPGNHFRGEILPALDRLKHDEIIRVLDTLIVRKDGLGNVLVAQASDLGWSHGSGPALRGTAADLALALCGRAVPAGRLRGEPLPRS